MKSINKLHFLIAGLILLILNIIIDLGFLQINVIKNVLVLKWILTIVSKIFSTIGLSMIIGHFTAKIKISEKIEDVINSKRKKEIINTLICKGNDLDSYKKLIVDNIYKYNSKYRTNVVYNVEVFKKDGIVCSEITINYTEYHMEDKFDIVRSYFDREDSETIYIKIINPNDANDSMIMTDNNIKKQKSTAFASALQYEHYCEIPRRFQKFKSLIIEKKILFKGHDHWLSCAMVFMCPHKGLNFTLTTKDNLIIKEDTIFGDDKAYTRTFNINKPNKIRLNSNQWLAGHHGFLIIVAESDS